MHVTVLAGGRGTRLASAWAGPKCLVPVGPNGTPFIWHKLEQLRENGATTFTVLVGPHLKEFRKFLGGQSGVRLMPDDQFGVADCIKYVGPNGWWTMGDVLCPLPLWGRDTATMYVYPRPGGNIAGLYVDCGLYLGTSKWNLVETPHYPYTINTPADLEATRAHLR